MIPKTIRDETAFEADVMDVRIRRAAGESQARARGIRGLRGIWAPRST